MDVPHLHPLDNRKNIPKNKHFSEITSHISIQYCVVTECVTGWGEAGGWWSHAKNKEEEEVKPKKCPSAYATN